MCQKESWGAIVATKEAHSTQRDQQPMHGLCIVFALVRSLHCLCPLSGQCIVSVLVRFLPVLVVVITASVFFDIAAIVITVLKC